MPRDSSIDAMRGLAVLMMAEVHIPVSTGLFQWTSNFLAVPFFLMIAGMSYELFVSAKPRAKIVTMSRALALYLITLIGEFIGSALWPAHYHFGLWLSTVFQVIVVGYILGVLIPGDLRSRLILFSGAIVLFFIVEEFDIPRTSFLTSGVFPILPWITYFLFGRLIQDIYSSTSQFLTKTRCFFGISLIGLGIHSHYIGTQELLLLPSIFLLFTLYILRNVNSNNIFYKTNSRIGRIAFTAYYIHITIIYIIWVLLAAPSDLLWYWNFTILVIIAAFLSKLESFWRNYNYILSVEYFFRQGSTMIAITIGRICHLIQGEI